MLRITEFYDFNLCDLVSLWLKYQTISLPPRHEGTKETTKCVTSVIKIYNDQLILIDLTDLVKQNQFKAKINGAAHIWIVGCGQISLLCKLLY